MAGFVIDILIAFVIRFVMIEWRRAKSHNWPVITGTILGSCFERPDIGCNYAQIRYRYKTSGERYDGLFKKPFLFQTYGEAFVRHFPTGSEIAVRVNPADMTKSFPVRG